MGYLRFVFATCDKRIDDFHCTRDLLMQDPTDTATKGVIFCFWHSRLLMPAFIYPRKLKRKLYILTSSHRDGRYTDAILRSLNVQRVFVSAHHGKGEALRKSVRILRHGAVLVFTPDGPLGPPRQAGPGSALMSRLSHAWIVPVSYAASRKKRLATWDKMLLPYPFGRLHFCIGKPFKYQDFADVEACRQHLQDELNRLGEQAEQQIHNLSSPSLSQEDPC